MKPQSAPLFQATPEIAERTLELSVVIPCLNEADTIGTCVQKAITTLREQGIDGEVLVADNGSTDGSQAIATQLGARVVPVALKGYGNALLGGIAAARGRFVIMGDADDSYDFREIPRFLEQLRKGYTLVQGCRLPAGNGTVMPGAMPFLHRWLGNPALTALARLMFKLSVHDIYCGMRGFTRDLVDRLALQCTGMEFATEMVIKSGVFGEKITEVPITLHPDGRRSHPPHLRTFRDGWRTLRFFLLCSPRWLFFYPGALLIVLGAVGYFAALTGMHVGHAAIGNNTLLVSTLFFLLGSQSLLFSLVSRTFAVTQRILPEDPILNRIYAFFPLERGLLVGLVSTLVGITMIAYMCFRWYQSGFGHLDYAQSFRTLCPATLFTSIGVQTILSSFFISSLNLRRK